VCNLYGMRRALVAVAFFALLTAAAADARVGLGVLGDPSRFQAQTGQRSSTRLIIVGWNQDGSPDYFTRLLQTMLDEPMVGLSSGSEGAPETITPAAIANGQGDGILVALNNALAEWRRPVFVRPLAEMNGHWNAYSAFNADGSSRGPSHSTAEFKKAFARIYLIVHGGASVDAKLHALGLPPVHGQLLPAPDVKVIWNPQGYGSPDLSGNTAEAYYPGDAYVDVVGDDLYDIKGEAAWASADALYNAHNNKPFSIPEWGLWGLDDPAFVNQMASFIRTHPRTVVANYYSGNPGSVFDLASKPHSLAAYRAAFSSRSR
jgi:hypothetical protein